LLRLSLRTLMLLIVVIAALLGWVTHRARVQREAVAAIIGGGGSVEYDYQISKPAAGASQFNANAQPRWRRWLFDRFGPDYLANVARVQVGWRKPDVVMAHVGRLSRLRFLSMGGTHIRPRLTDADMTHLRGLTQLEELNLHVDAIPITGASLVNLKGMSRLRVLYMPLRVADQDLASLSRLTALESIVPYGDSNITDAGLAHLEPLGNLKMLSLRGGNVTSAGLARLRGMTRMRALDLSATRVDTLGPLCHMKTLKYLYLESAPINDSGLAHIADLTELSKLDLSGTQVTDAGIPNLLRCPWLSNLDLSGTRITDAGLIKLAGLKTLQRLSISKPSAVTDQGIAALRRARPDLYISSD
jgi:hypothetical protein